MNKRQYKKARKKINRVYLVSLVDDFWTIGYDKEELQLLFKDIDEYCYKNYRYKHYKDKKDSKEPLIDWTYYPPMKKSMSNYCESLIATARYYKPNDEVIIDIMDNKTLTADEKSNI